MAIIKCKMCGGDLILQPNSTTAECEYCGTVQTVPSADNEKKLTLFARANRLRMACEFDKAAGVYEAIIADFPEEAEAFWGLVLCKYGIEYVDDPASGKKLPTCHRSSFDSVMDDSNFEQALENADVIARKVYRDEAKQIEGIRKGIIEVSSREDPYDIFLCYKETDINGNRTLDSVLAQDIYTALTEKGYRVFFSRITLEDKLGQEYEPYIFAALNSAKVMLAVGTDYEHYNAVWVKNEWSRFLHMISTGQKKTLIPCYKNIDAYDMPKEFAKLQAQDLGKVGSIQDLLRGVDKILSKPVAPTANMQSAAQEAVRTIEQEKTRKQVENAVSLGVMALDSGDAAKATKHFEEALKLDSECIGAYLGLIRTIQDRSKASSYIKKIKSMPSDLVLQYVKDHRFVIGDTQSRNNLLTIATNPLFSPQITFGLLEMGVDGNAKNALMYSIEAFDDSNVTKAFIRNGADVNTNHQWNYKYKNPGERYGYDERESHSVLSMAIRNRRSNDTIKALINAGADVNYIIQIFNGAYVDDRKKKYSFSILNKALRQRHYDLGVIEMLLEKGADVNVKRANVTEVCWYYSDGDISGSTASRYNEYSSLSDAVWNIKDRDIVKLLLKYGADPNAIDNRIHTRKESDKKYFLQGTSRSNALIDAVLYSNDIEMVNILLQKGANPNSIYYYEGLNKYEDVIYKTEIPVLGLAIQKCRPDVVKLLLDAGASFSDQVIYQYANYDRTSWKEDVFPLSELMFEDTVVLKMGNTIRPLGWKGSKSGWFKKQHICNYT